MPTMVILPARGQLQNQSKPMPVHRRTDTISVERSGGTGHVRTCTAFCQRSCLVAADDGSRAQSLHSCKLANQHLLVDLRKRRQSTLQQPTWHAVACGSLCLCDQHARAPAMSWVAHAQEFVDTVAPAQATGSYSINSADSGSRVSEHPIDLGRAWKGHLRNRHLKS